MTVKDQTEKRTLRKQIWTHCLRLSDEEALIKSHRIQALLFSLPEFQQASFLLFYMAIRGEVQTEAMVRSALQLGKQVAVPLVDTQRRGLRISLVTDVDRDLQPGHFGILEPRPDAIREVSPEDVDIALIPGVAFDRSGGRLGRGGGYYDRFLSTLPARVLKIGLAFHLQLVPCVPRYPHDVPVDMLVTEKEVIVCQAKGGISKE
ncbi:MAG: 5-formyltetrahydrofolate cyclo-ligase [Nitrospinota bacterium]|nr:MAG: 5-formyltetrahydrofolate cyclo-ligase [Nitrospinota bacterium]